MSLRGFFLHGPPIFVTVLLIRYTYMIHRYCTLLRVKYQRRGHMKSGHGYTDRVLFRKLGRRAANGLPTVQTYQRSIGAQVKSSSKLAQGPRICAHAIVLDIWYLVILHSSTKPILGKVFIIFLNASVTAKLYAISSI